MKNLILTLAVGVLIGIGGTLLFDKDTSFDLDAALKSGGLTLDKPFHCVVPMSNEYCALRHGSFGSP